MKNCLHLTFVKKLKSIKFCDYRNYICVNDGYQDLVTKPLSVIDIFAPIKTLKIKPNTKPFDINIGF